MKRRVGIGLASLVLGHALGVAASSIKAVPLVLSSDQLPPAPRWMYEGKTLPKMPAPAAALAEMRQAELSQDSARCVRLAQRSFQLAPTVSAWVASSALGCALEGVKNNKVKSEALRQILLRIEKNSSWWMMGPQKVQLRRDFIRAMLVLIESEIKTSRATAWADVEKLTQLDGDLNPDDKSELYRLAGEILFIEQSLDGARAYYERSYALKPTDLVRDRLHALKSATGETTEPTTGARKSGGTADLEASTDELELVNRITESLTSGDPISAVQDAEKLNENYPGGTRKAWAVDRIIESYLNLLGQTDAQFAQIKDHFVRQMLKFDSETMYAWAKKLFARGYYAEAKRFAQKSLSEMGSVWRATGAVSVAARSALYTDQWSEAEKWFHELEDKHAGTPEAVEAVFYLGLLHFRQKDYSRAAGYFERLLVLPKSDNYELSARYWLWRSLDRAKLTTAPEQARLLIEKFPFSYYGLRARAETTGNLKFQWEPRKVSYKFWLTKSERECLKRVELLLQAGWWQEAESELESLPQANSVDGKALMALYYARAMNYVRSSGLLNEAWDQRQDLRNPPFLRAVFPDEFAAALDKEAQTLRLSPILLRSLIKQESAFNVRALSTSQAMGLMQLIPPTAQDMATRLGIQRLKIPDDVFQFETNIHMGSSYLASLLDHYSQNVPMSLAAYNAGPGRLDHWLSGRPSLADLKTRLSSAPQDELWIEELPWSETRQYVKAILRNSLLYRALPNGRVQLDEPLWRDLVKDRLSSH